MVKSPNHLSPDQLSRDQLVRDTRSTGKRFAQALFRPATFRKVLIAVILFQFYMPAFWPVSLIVIWVLVLSYQDYKFHMPLRMPKDIGGIDRTDYTETIKESSFLFGLFKNTKPVRRYADSGGIMYLGFMRSKDLKDVGRELWLTNSDARTHMSLPATTGGGKTETINGMSYNGLCWGSGYTIADGKGTNELPFSHWCLTRRLGREDDFLVLNYLRGGQDPYERLVQAEEKRAQDAPINEQSNSINPFSDGTADFIIQLLTSLLPKATGDGAKWQKAAIAMMSAVVRTLCYKRAKGEVELSISEIQKNMELHGLVKLYKEGIRGEIPEKAFSSLKTYLEQGLPGFNINLIDKPEEWEPEVFTQHGYLARDFIDPITMMSDTYGYIFEDTFAEIDMQDVLLNNRILIVLIPSMDKSSSEAGSLGKLFVSATRLMMARNLGEQIEGYSTLIDVKSTNSPNPYIIFLDELGYYFAEGIAVMFAQARSMGFMLVSAFQDIQALKRGDGSGEYASMIANTKVKWVLALEDPEDTFEMVRKAAGTAYYSMLSGHDTVQGSLSHSYKAQYTTSVYEKDRITLPELKRLNSGEGVLVFKDSVIPTQSFYIPSDKKVSQKLQVRINRFIQVERPSLSRKPDFMKPVNEAEIGSEAGVIKQFSIGEKPYYHGLDDPILDAVKEAASGMDGLSDDDKLNATERGVFLYEAARRAMYQAKSDGYTGYMHSAVYDDLELTPEMLTDEVES
ncbi:TraM recognition domain-containing protein [Zooshikella marina]|uniref:TraM recognition domain-containing protein n=1 Tax=Zooshikella ganghwensis TaxID=202772 RepID=UPI001BAE9A3B|nr:TraM recognition domain-containing protein [Zooshikella ganghwensis]MBU2708717.1 TraM recognition domain-containing protein [Zooshikella ganghwensis]